MELLEPVQLGPYQLTNRLVMGAYCRMAAADYCPTAAAADQYAQCSSAGLLITEPTLVDLPVLPLPGCPGLFNRRQVEAWRQVTQAVHARGGKIFVQLWHSANLFHLCESEPQAAAMLPQGCPAEGWMTLSRTAVVEQFRKAAQNAIAADFDGIEIHGAFRALTERITRGRSLPVDYLRAEGLMYTETALLLEIAENLGIIWDNDRVGLFLSCSFAYGAYGETQLEEAMYILVEALSYNRFAYLHLAEATPKTSFLRSTHASCLKTFRPIFQGPVIADGQDNLRQSAALVAQRQAALVSFRRRFAAQPDWIDQMVLNKGVDSQSG
ncbi:MAG: hypothetical protein ACFB5Z_13680 [Elainellaceae cyanobacterium]